MSLVHLISVQSHTFMSCPLATFTIASWPNPSGGFNTSILPENLREGFVFGDQDQNLINLQTAFKRYNSTRFYDFVSEFTIFDDAAYDKSCGTTVLDKPQPLPEYFKFSPIPHYGVCQIECNKTIVFESQNCQLAFGADWTTPITPEIRATCEHSVAIFSYIAPHGDPWQSYINCVNVGGNDDPMPEKAKQECKPGGAKNGTVAPTTTPGQNGTPTPTPGQNGTPTPTPGQNGTSTPTPGVPAPGYGTPNPTPGVHPTADGPPNSSPPPPPAANGTPLPAPVPTPTETNNPDNGNGSGGGKDKKGDIYGTPKDGSKPAPGTSPYGTEQQGHSSKCTIRKIRR
uniref:AlNc14C85G5442 protein n=1 Tax=Albugo laibachii Nc14 TaxID=890382 RepID=F0WFQ7_9STRA|nr:AlNc14C85G5442 [Albugo laibachii Nc14]|eukprot:CCA20041.1 AlNc14C85G5442 [Albugo laibachii Nc14]